MSEESMNADLLEAVKKHMPAAQLEVIKTQIALADRVPKLEQDLKSQESNIQQLMRELALARETNRQRLEENNALKAENLELTVSNREFLIKQSAMNLYMEDRERLFGIVDNAYKHYTHTTTRQVVVPGGQYLQQSFAGPHPTDIPVDAPSAVETHTDVTKSE